MNKHINSQKIYEVLKSLKGHGPCCPILARSMWQREVRHMRKKRNGWKPKNWFILSQFKQSSYQYVLFVITRVVTTTLTKVKYCSSQMRAHTKLI